MHGQWRNRAYKAAVIIFLSSGAAYAECDSTAQTGSTTSRLDALAACLSKQADEIRNLKGQLANVIPAVGNNEDTKAIVAYFSNKGEKTCPEGWSPYEPAINRMIVGASTDKYPQVGQTGGAETVTLTEAQMPVHQHTQTIGVGVANTGTAFGTAARGIPNAPAVDIQPTRAAGGNQPHTNMPPYIALYFCKKG